MKLGETESLCPKCMKRIPAELVEENGAVKIKKTCPEHGEFEDVYWSNIEHYKWVMKFQNDGDGIENPRTRRTERGCPYDCGLCEEHKSHTVLGIVDVTNRCNLRCPVCFANAATTGYVYEPTKEQVKEMLQNLRNNKPVPCYSFQFSGGEPTLRDDLPELVKIGKELGFLFIMVDTNGIRIAEDRKYLKALKDAGLDSFYLQFDGLDDKVYKELRGRKLLKTKIRAIENCRRIGLKNVVLVVTLVKGINDDQLGGIIKFAVENSDVVTCVNVQPISFAGRVSDVEREKGRITTYDFINLVEKQTHGRIKAKYFYPVPSMVPISRFIEAETSEPTTKFSAHPCCGVGTYIIINEDKSYTPINELVNIDKFLSILQKSYSKTTRLEISANLLGDAIKNIRDPRHREVIRQLLKEGTFESAAAFHKNAIMIGCMHFQDLWNFDLERVQRCVIHYSLPDGRLISFCSYNNLHREILERKFSIPLEEWRKNHGNLPISAYC